MIYTVSAVNVDEGVVSQLVDMGFPRNACIKGVHFSNNTGIEAAMNWIMEHMDDTDFDSPLQQTGTGGGTGQQFEPDEGSLSMIESMGFSQQQAVTALKATDNNLERAIDWIFNHPDEVDQQQEQQMDQSSAAEPQYADGPGVYQLVAFISHMGTSTKCGHYVCHIRRGDQWVIFNDEKVSVSERPPKDLAYIYLYRRL